MYTCAVASCDSNSCGKNVTFFRGPIKNEEEAKGWIDFITEANSGVIPHASPGRLYVCSKHFRKCCIYSCHPRRTTRVNGHFPSVVDGKVIFNSKSKCALVSPPENLQMFSKPAYRNPQEKQRDYLVKQLTSFGGQKRKIVIGNGNDKQVTKKLNEKLCLEKDTLNKSVPPVPPVAGETCDKGNTHSQSPGPKLKEDNMCPVPKIEMSIKKGKKETTELVIKTPGQISTHRKPRKGSSFARIKRITTPSSETKMRLLKRDNVNLKKSVYALEKKVDELENEIRKVRNTSLEIETWNKSLLKNFQKRLKQKNGKPHSRKADASTSTEVTSNCKCASIVFVDIAED